MIFSRAAVSARRWPGRRALSLFTVVVTGSLLAGTGGGWGTPNLTERQTWEGVTGWSATPLLRSRTDYFEARPPFVDPGAGQAGSVFQTLAVADDNWQAFGYWSDQPENGQQFLYPPGAGMPLLRAGWQSRGKWASARLGNLLPEDSFPFLFARLQPFRANPYQSVSISPDREINPVAGPPRMEGFVGPRQLRAGGLVARGPVGRLVYGGIRSFWPAGPGARKREGGRLNLGLARVQKNNTGEPPSAAKPLLIYQDLGWQAAHAPQIESRGRFSLLSPIFTLPPNADNPPETKDDRPPSGDPLFLEATALELNSSVSRTPGGGRAWWYVGGRYRQFPLARQIQSAMYLEENNTGINSMHWRRGSGFRLGAGQGIWGARLATRSDLFRYYRPTKINRSGRLVREWRGGQQVRYQRHWFSLLYRLKPVELAAGPVADTRLNGAEIRQSRGYRVRAVWHLGRWLARRKNFTGLPWHAASSRLRSWKLGIFWEEAWPREGGAAGSRQLGLDLTWVSATWRLGWGANFYFGEPVGAYPLFQESPTDPVGKASVAGGSAEREFLGIITGRAEVMALRLDWRGLRQGGLRLRFLALRNDPGHRELSPMPVAEKAAWGALAWFWRLHI